jgi:hypothetical protein
MDLKTYFDNLLAQEGGASVAQKASSAKKRSQKVLRQLGFGSQSGRGCHNYSPFTSPDPVAPQVGGRRQYGRGCGGSHDMEQDGGRKAVRRSGRKSARKSGRKAVRRSGRKSARKSGRKSGRKSARKSGRKAVRRSGRKSGRKSARKSGRKSARKSGRKSGRKSARKSATKKRSASKKVYTTLVNGGEAFEVMINGKNVNVKYIENGKKFSFSTIRIFKGEKNKSFLLQLNKEDYVYIGANLIKFTPKEKITSFKGVIGNSGVLYPFVSTKSYIYTLVGDDRGIYKYAPKESIDDPKDPYQTLYFSSPSSFSKFTVKTLQKRLD